MVVNNAGYAQQGTVEALSDEELRQNFDVNLFAPLMVLRHALPHLREQRGGHVINIASIVGFQGGYAGWGSYVASKFALAGLTESLAAEVAEFGIKATVVYPGPVRTEFLSSGALRWPNDRSMNTPRPRHRSICTWARCTVIRPATRTSWPC